MAYQCVNASNQYFAIAAPNIVVPPVTFSVWINVASIVAKSTGLFMWRGTVNSGLLLNYTSPNWELRYYIAGGTQWQTATGLYVSTGAWQHACAAITSSQARLYLNGASFTNNVSHSTASIDEAGNLARDPLVDANHTSFNGSVAEAAIWTAALSDEECFTLAQRVSPLQLKNRLHDLVLYKDMLREPNRGPGPALTAVNAPSVVAHPPLIHPGSRLQAVSMPAHFLSPYRVSIATAHTSPAIQGCAESVGAAQGAVGPLGEVSS